jgi:thiosulfate/3-mercaptopyruvate sulfurtransferase
VVDGSWYLPTMNRDPEAEYRAGHIPGAVRFDIDAIRDKDSPLPHMLPSPEAFASAMRALGIGDGMTIVVYDGAGLFSAPRVWWTLRTFGARDGRSWRRLPACVGTTGSRERGGIAARWGRPSRPAGTFRRGRPLRDVRRALETSAAQGGEPAADRFRGEAPEPRTGVPARATSRAA